MLRIFDAHVHLFDCKANTYAFLEHEDRSFKAIAGDYSALPRRYLTDDYLNDSASCEVEGIVWYEFLSANPVREARWAQDRQIVPPLRVIVLVAILALVAGFASAQPGSSNLDIGKELVAQLYKEHSGKSDPLQYPASKKRVPSYFYKPLLDLYLKDQENSKGEVGKIDFDPLYDSQDFEISGFNLVVLPKKKGYVAARFKNMGVDQEIIFALQRTMGWRIADIRYKDGRSLWKILKG